MPKWPWNLDRGAGAHAGNANFAQLAQALVHADTPEEWGTIVKAQRETALSAGFLAFLSSTAQSMRREGERKFAVQMDKYIRLVTHAREQGIDAAVAYEKQHLHELFEAMKDYLTSPMPETRAAFDRNSALLMSDEGLEYIIWAARKLREPENMGGAAEWEAKTKNRFRDLRVRFIEDARFQGIDYAEQRLSEGLGDLLGKGFEEYRNLTDPDLE